jgi:hypothetical protein
VSAPLPTHLASMDRLDIARSFAEAMIRAGWDRPAAEIITHAVDLADVLLGVCVPDASPAADENETAANAAHFAIQSFAMALSNGPELTIGKKHPRADFIDMANDFARRLVEEHFSTKAEEA